MLNKKVYIMYGLLLVGCGPLTSADKSKIIKTNLDASRAGCLVYQADKTIERDSAIDEYCDKLIGTCPKLSIKDEVRSVSP